MSESTELARATPDVGTLIQFAIERNSGPETMQGLYDLAKRMKEDAAEEAFNVAFTKFQQICPPIVKDKKAPNNRFASLENIKKVIQPYLAECSLSYSFTAGFTDTSVKAVCTVRHIAGHSKQSEFVAPISDVIRSKTGNVVTNGMQMTAMSHTYAKRYALVDALGLTIADEDTDGYMPPQPREDAPIVQPRPDRVNGEDVKKLIDYWKETQDAYGRPQTIEEFTAFSAANGGPSKDCNKHGSWTPESITSVGRAIDKLQGVK